MSAEPLRLSLRRLEIDPPTLSARELGRALQQMSANGLLRQAEPASAVPCLDCGGGSLLPVQYIRHNIDGTMHPYLACAECGVNEIAPSRLQRWSVDTPGMLSALFAGDDRADYSPAEIVPGHLWRLGKMAWSGRSREVFFARAFRPSRGGAIVDAMRRRPKTLLIMPSELGVTRWGNATENLVMALESVARLVSSGIELDHDLIESRVDPFFADKPTKPRTRRRSSRMADIERLEKELMQHLHAARDHAVMTRDLSGDAKLLDRPTKEQLGKMAGVSASSVTRCLQDEAGEKLRHMWELAGDLDRIIGFRDS